MRAVSSHRLLRSSAAGGAGRVRAARTWARIMLLAASMGVLLAATAMAMARPLPRLLGGYARQFQVRPAVIFYDGDGSAVAGGPVPVAQRRRGNYGHIAWTRWNGKRGLGHGRLWIDDCTPDCAGGTFRPHPLTVVASRARGGLFTLLTLDYRQDGRPATATATLVRMGANAFWRLA